jgi:hypothetical protein
MAQMTVKVIDVLAFLGYRCPGSSQVCLGLTFANLDIDPWITLPWHFIYPVTAIFLPSFPKVMIADFA